MVLRYVFSSSNLKWSCSGRIFPQQWKHLGCLKQSFKADYSHIRGEWASSNEEHLAHSISGLQDSPRTRRAHAKAYTKSYRRGLPSLWACCFACKLG